MKYATDESYARDIKNLFSFAHAIHCLSGINYSLLIS